MSDLMTWLRAQLDIDDEIAQDIAVTSDPDRWRAEIEVKRGILDEHSATDGEGGLACDRCSQYGIGWWVPAPCLSVRLLTLPFTRREGYRDEWRP